MAKVAAFSKREWKNPFIDLNKCFCYREIVYQREAFPFSFYFFKAWIFILHPFAITLS